MTEATPAPSVQAAWAAVMADVQALGKDQAVTSGPARFKFRGIDDVMNAVGPVLRKHGVSVIPTDVSHSPEDVTTSKGARMRNVTVFVKYAIHGPNGDTMIGGAAGEAADSGDKATPKAMSVAFRTFLLQALCLPTDEPDPDTHQYERGGPVPEAVTREGILARLAAAPTVEAAGDLWRVASTHGFLDDAMKAAITARADELKVPAVAS